MVEILGSMKPPKPVKARIVRKTFLRKLVFDRDQGICCGCGKYDPHWEHDHDIPLSMGGQDTLANSKTRCRRCHREKTNSEAPIRAKTDRIRDRHELTRMRREVR